MVQGPDIIEIRGPFLPRTEKFQILGPYKTESQLQKILTLE